MFFSITNVKVYFHKINQFLDLNGRMGYKIYQKEIVQNQVNTQDLRMLPNKELDGSSSCAHINYDECIYQSLIQHMKNKTSEFVPLRKK